MILSLAVVVGILFAVIGVRKGFFGTWIVLFNILISIYIGVMLSPTLVAFRPDMEQQRYYLSAFTAMTSFMLFIVLQTIVIGCFGDLAECFCPKVFDTVGAAILGFLGGFCVFSFVFFIVCIMPLSKTPSMKSVCGDGTLTPVGVVGVVKACDFVSTVSLQPHGDTHKRVRKVVDWLVRLDYPHEYELGNKKKADSPGFLYSQ